MVEAEHWTIFLLNDYGVQFKYEKVYLNDFQTVKEAYRGLKDYFEFYNHKRIHQSLDYKTPAEVYF